MHLILFETSHYIYSMGKPLFIGITGGSGSGKTCVIRDLRAQFTHEEVCIISQDDYYLPREQQKYDEEGVQNFDLPESIDHVALASDILKLAAGESITRAEYVFNNDQAVPSMLTFNPAPVIIVEGLFVFNHSEIYDQLDVKVFVHADDVRKLKRRIIRDRNERNYPLEDVLYRYEAHVLPAYLKYIKPFKNMSDIVINNNGHYQIGLDFLISFIKDRVKNEIVVT